MSFLINWLLNNYIEIIGFSSGIIGVWLSTRQNIWCWPVGLINVSLYMYIFYDSNLFADFGLQVFYFVMTIYGWYQWKYGGKSNTGLKVQKTTIRLWVLYFIVGAISNLIAGYLLATYTRASFPYWDSFVSVWGIIATFMQARKQLENWLVWIVIDLNCVAIYFYKELYITLILYFVFTLLAVAGYLQWRKTLNIKKAFNV